MAISVCNFQSFTSTQVDLLPAIGGVANLSSFLNLRKRLFVLFFLLVIKLVWQHVPKQNYFWLRQRTVILQRGKQQCLAFLVVQSLVLGIFYLLVCYLGNIPCCSLFFIIKHWWIKFLLAYKLSLICYNLFVKINCPLIIHKKLNT